MIATKESFEPSTLRSNGVGEVDPSRGGNGKETSRPRNATAEDGHSSEQLPNSKKVFVPGKIHADVRVPMREIEVSPTKSYTGAVEANAPRSEEHTSELQSRQ